MKTLKIAWRQAGVVAAATTVLVLVCFVSANAKYKVIDERTVNAAVPSIDNRRGGVDSQDKESQPLRVLVPLWFGFLFLLFCAFFAGAGLLRLAAILGCSACGLIALAVFYFLKGQ